jgi:uroporphyrinogen III methyltransferase/synthase
VGAGPGDPGLLTLRGRALLERADTVVYDRLVSPEILSSIPAGTRQIDAGKAGHRSGMAQEEIHRILAEEAQSGKNVVRLKGGDPTVFGRGGEEALFLAGEGIAAEIVPGVTAAIAVPALAGIPVTHRGVSSSVHILTWIRRHKEPPQEELEALVRAGGTIVILMGGRAANAVGARLIEAGLPPQTAAAVIENGTTPAEKIRQATLAQLASPAFSPPEDPATIVVGAVCLLRDRLQGSAAGRLPGRRVAIARPAGSASSLRALIEEEGGKALEIFCTETRPIAPPENLAEEIRQSSWLVFVSQNGVRYFFDAFFAAGGDLRSLASSQIAAIGPTTAAALRASGFTADFVPSHYDSKTFGAELAEVLGEKERVLIPRSKQGSEELGDTLRSRNIDYREIAVYETVPRRIPAAVRQDLLADAFDFVFFTAPSAVESLTGSLPELPWQEVQAICIGEPTARAAAAAGMVTFTAAEATPKAMRRVWLDRLEKEGKTV